MPLITHLPGNHHRFPRVIPLAPPIGSNEQHQQSQAPEEPSNGEFHPTPRDIRHVRQILTRKGSLPPEVVDIILESAEYWACTAAFVDYSNERAGHLSVRGGRSPREDRFLVRRSSLDRYVYIDRYIDRWMANIARF